MRREITPEQKKALIDKYKKEYNPDFFKKKLKEILKDKHMTQKELAEKIGIQPAAFTKYFDGTNRPLYKNMADMARILGIDQRSLYTEEYYNEKKQGDEVLQAIDADMNAIYERNKPLIEYLKSIGYIVDADYANIAFSVCSPNDIEGINPIYIDFLLADKLEAAVKKAIADSMYDNWMSGN